MSTKILVNPETGAYTYAETPNTVITDILKDQLKNNISLELYKVEYKEEKPVYVVQIDKDGDGETINRKTLKAAQKKYGELLEVEAMKIAEWDAECGWKNCIVE